MLPGIGVFGTGKFYLPKIVSYLDFELKQLCHDILNNNNINIIFFVCFRFYFILC